MNSFTDATTQISKKESYKMHVATLKQLYYKKFFDHGQTIIMVKQNLFKIYWVCKLFEECRPDKSFTQRDILKSLSDKYLYWGRLSQINDRVPHHACFCYHCKIYNDSVQILLQRGKIDEEPKEKEVDGVSFDACEMYRNILSRKRRIALEYAFFLKKNGFL